MTIAKNINSQPYWDMRFSSDWDSLNGPAQSRGFAWLALQEIPEWLLRTIRQDALTVVDWGCAQGEGTNVWASYVPAANLFGVDFSPAAIEKAKEKYPNISFECSDWLRAEASSQPFDIVFSSNTLEHFSDPYAVLQHLAKRARKAIVLLLPYKELNRIDEHEYTFLPQNIPAKLDNGFSLVWTRVSGPHDFWNGEQVLLVYAKDDWVEKLNLSLRELSIESDNSNSFKNELTESQKMNSDLQVQLADLQGRCNRLEEQSMHARVEIEQAKLALEENEQAKHSFTKIQQENNIKLDSLQKEIALRDAESSQLRYELKNFRASASWRITSPLRSLYKSVSKIGTPAFLSLPAGLQKSILHRVNPVAHPLSKNIEQFNNLRDISWENFTKNILAHRGRYKGVFIQEAVIDWNVPLYQRPQHIAVAMARQGYLVIYRTENWAADDVNGFREVEKNVWITNCSEVDEIDDVIRSIYSTAYATSVENIKKLRAKGTVLYEYIDHIDAEISGNENIKDLISLKDFAFSGGADYIIASAQILYDEAESKAGGNKTIMVKNGVDILHYRNPLHKTRELPESLVDFKRKFKYVVGYFGALAPWLWYETIAELVHQKSDVGFVFIGPDYYGGIDSLPKADNVLYLGTVDYKILPSYGMSFDVCLIPFKPGDIAKTTSPLKLFEYFALEKPVVVTSDMAECVRYPEVFHGASADALSTAIDQAIAIKDDVAFKKRLSALADENSWDMRAASLIAGMKN